MDEFDKNGFEPMGIDEDDELDDYGFEFDDFIFFPYEEDLETYVEDTQKKLGSMLEILRKIEEIDTKNSSEPPEE